ncbi:hypothetical protein Tco_1251626 [Tanacetum coccineum]
MVVHLPLILRYAYKGLAMDLDNWGLKKLSSDQDVLQMLKYEIEMLRGQCMKMELEDVSEDEWLQKFIKLSVNMDKKKLEFEDETKRSLMPVLCVLPLVASFRTSVHRSDRWYRRWALVVRLNRKRR